MSNASGSIFEIRKNVFAFGIPGTRALAVVEKTRAGWQGVRGVKPLIGLNAKQGNVPTGAAEKLAELTKVAA